MAVVIWGIAPIIALAVRLDVALIFALIATVVVLLTTCFISLVRGHVAANWLMAYTMVCAGLLVTIAEIVLGLFAPNLRQNMGLYLPVLAVSPLVMNQLDENGASRTFITSLAATAKITIRFIALMLGMAIIRELLADGRLTLSAVPGLTLQWLVPGLSQAPVAFLATTAGGLLLTGFLLAGRNWLLDRQSTKSAPSAPGGEA